MLLLLAHPLQLLVDLLRCLDSIGGIWLRWVGGGRSGGRGWVDRRNVGGRLGLRWRRLRLQSLDWSFLWLGSVVGSRCVWIWRRWATLTRREDKLGGFCAVALHEDHVAAGAVQ